MRSFFLGLCAAVVLASATEASAAPCVNRFLRRSESARQIVTFLTGKLTFQEAQLLSKSIIANKAEPVEWVDDKGKTLAKQIGELKVVRPMPVGCDGKTSGVVIIATFLAVRPPVGKMHVKLNPSTTVVFDEQKSAQ
jgi:hypothetical protein